MIYKKMEYLNLCEDLDDGPLVIHSLNDLDEYLEILPQDTILCNLSLQNTNLAEIPREIFEFESLHTLSISTCLNEISSKIDRLQNLRFLNLGGNNLTDLPNTIQNLPHLRYLGIARNKFTSIPDSIRI
ncbi:MAG: leucine-rich repeat domain-containing protein [Promethearchaeota archaeon]